MTSRRGKARQQLDPARLQLLRGAERVRASTARVGHGRDFDPGVEELLGVAVAPVAGRHDHGTGAGLHAVEARQPLRAGAEHDAGQVVPVERHGYLVRARRHDDLPGPQLQHGVAAMYSQQVALVQAEGRRVVHDLDAAVRAHLVGQRGYRRPSVRVAAELTAQRRLVVDQDDRDAGGGRRERRGHARRSAAHDRDVGVAVLVVVVRLRSPVHTDRPQAGETAYDRRCEPPGEAGLVQRLVVEADRHQTVEPVKYR